MLCCFLIPLPRGIWDDKFYSCLYHIGFHAITFIPLEKMFQNLYTRSETIKGMPNSVLDFIAFPFRVTFILAVSRGVHVPWTHSSIFFKHERKRVQCVTSSNHGRLQITFVIHRKFCFHLEKLNYQYLG